MEKQIPRLKLVEWADFKEKAKNPFEHLGKKNRWCIRSFKNYIRLFNNTFWHKDGVIYLGFSSKENGYKTFTFSKNDLHLEKIRRVIKM